MSSLYIQNYSYDSSGSGLWRAATMKIGSGRLFTDQATIKCIKTLKSGVFIFKGQGPLKIKKNIQQNNGKS
jgi:hypothetical protein